MARCIGCGVETDTPWQCTCGFSRLPTQAEVDDLIRRLVPHVEEWRKWRQAVIERELERRRQAWAERLRREAELEAEMDADWRRVEAERRREEAARREEAVRAQRLYEERLRQEEERVRQEAERKKAERAAAKAEQKPPEPVVDPPEVRREVKRYRRARAKIRGMVAERRFFEQRTEAAHQYFLHLADQIAESLPERGRGEIWWD